MQIWHVSAPRDGYFVGVLIADSEDQARGIAWERFKLSRPDVFDGDHEWEGYHRSPDELLVKPLGEVYFDGGDGHGRIEVDR